MRKRFKIDVYAATFTVLCLEELKELNDEFPHLAENIRGFENYGALTFWKDKDSGYTEYYIAFNKLDCSIGLIAHESVHLANIIFKHRDVILDIENDEPYAYLVGFIVKKITKFLYKKPIIS